MMDLKAAGIIFPNIHDARLPELLGHRTMGSLPFCGRYRMIDFCLSGMAGAGIQNVAIIANKNYQSLMDHLGNGREWDLSRKRGGLVIFPPYGRESGGAYKGRIESVASVLTHLESLDEELVVLSDCDIACNMDYKDLISAHQKSGADVTAVYTSCEMADGLKHDNVAFNINAEGTITSIRVNEYKLWGASISSMWCARAWCAAPPIWCGTTWPPMSKKSTCAATSSPATARAFSTCKAISARACVCLIWPT